MAIRNCAAPAPKGPIGRRCSPALRKKPPQANTRVAVSTSQGSRRAKKRGGVASSSAAPAAPPARLISNSARNDSRSAPEMSDRLASPVVTWPGNRAMVEVMFAVRASRPERISAGSVTNEPPPASAFWVPAQRPAATSSGHMRPSYGRRRRRLQPPLSSLRARPQLNDALVTFGSPTNGRRPLRLRDHRRRLGRLRARQPPLRRWRAARAAAGGGRQGQLAAGADAGRRRPADPRQGRSQLGFLDRAGTSSRRPPALVAARQGPRRLLLDQRHGLHPRSRR